MTMCFRNRQLGILWFQVQNLQDAQGPRTEILVCQIGDGTKMFFHRLSRPGGASSSWYVFHDFPHTCRHDGGDKRAQSQTYADQGNVQIVEYNIHAESHQSVTEEQCQIRSGRGNSGFRTLSAEVPPASRWTLPADLQPAPSPRLTLPVSRGATSEN